MPTLAVVIEERAVGAAWVERHGIVVDSIVVAATPEEVVRKWGVPGVPSTIVIDTAGAVTFAKLGLLAKPDIDRAVRLLAGGLASRFNSK